ncbi:MAG: SCO family protein [Phycisphaerae bacterium]|nr:SCO family protein [Phycisphaerae bacterium]
MGLVNGAVRLFRFNQIVGFAVVAISIGSLVAPRTYAGEFRSMQSVANTHTESRSVGITPHPGAQLPLHLHFTNSHGQTVRLGQYFRAGRPVILSLVYYKCYGVCPFVEIGLLRAIEKMNATLGHDYEVVTISFSSRDRAADAAIKKAHYLVAAPSQLRSAISKHWHFLVGTKTVDRKIASTIGFRYRWNPTIQMYDHQAAIYVCTPTGKIANYFFGVHYQPESLRLAIVQAGDQKISNVFDQILLFCVSFNPQTGKYTAIAYRVVFLSGIAVLIALGALFGWLWWWERRYRRKGEPVKA